MELERSERLLVLNPQRLASLEEWLQRTSIKLTQVNGQRKYGGPPPDWIGPGPGAGCEVFISQIPRDVYEDRLIPLFQGVGQLYEFRLMMNFSGQNRGFAYAKYGDPGAAAAAIRAFHLHRLQEGARLTVRRSTEKRQLCLGELPAGVGRDELLQVLRDLSEGVEGLTLKSGGARGGREVIAMVHYSSHYAASMAKKVLVQAFKKQYGTSITVKWMSFSSKPKHEEESREEVPLTPPRLLPKASNTPPRFHLGRAPPGEVLLPRRSPQSFSRAVGGPAASPARDGGVEARRDAVVLLQRVCELHGLGRPLYELRYHHTGPNGFLHFAWRVAIPGLPMPPLSGAAQILPGAVEGEVHRAAAEQVLRALCQP